MAQPRDRGDVDDSTAPLRFHHRQGVLAGEEGAGEVDVHLLVPDFVREFHRPARLGAPDIVDEDVEPVEIGPDAGKQISDGGLVGDVTGMPREAAPLPLDQPLRLGQRFRIAIDADDPRALAGEDGGDGLAVAESRPARFRLR